MLGFLAFSNSKDLEAIEDPLLVPTITTRRESYSKQFKESNNHNDKLETAEFRYALTENRQINRKIHSRPTTRCCRGQMCLGCCCTH